MAAGEIGVSENGQGFCVRSGRRVNQSGRGVAEIARTIMIMDRSRQPEPVGALPTRMDNESGNIREPLMFLFGKSEHYGADRASSILTGSTMKGQVCFFSGLHGSALPSCGTSDGRIAPIDSLDQGSLTMIPRFMAAVLCVLGPLPCVAYGGNINGEATFVSFSVPGTVGTYPMSINASMTVTGYYYVTPSVARGFLRGRMQPSSHSRLRERF
jgi:hypothetical protein